MEILNTWQTHSNNGAAINLAKFEAGIYFLTVTIDGVKQMQKIVTQ